MTPLAALAKLGYTWDGLAAAVRATPRRAGAVLAVRRHRHRAVVVAGVVLVSYLFSIGDLAISTTGRWVDAPLLRAVPENLLDSRAPYLFEPVLALYPNAHFVVFFSPLNLLLGAIVAVLAGCNVAVAGYAAQLTACRWPGYGRLLGVLPAFLLGFACCMPVLLLALGTATGAALLPLLLPLRPVFYPLTLALLVSALVWGTHRLVSRRPAARSR